MRTKAFILMISCLILSVCVCGQWIEGWFSATDPHGQRRTKGLSLTRSLRSLEHTENTEGERESLVSFEMGAFEDFL